MTLGGLSDGSLLTVSKATRLLGSNYFEQFKDMLHDVAHICPHFGLDAGPIIFLGILSGTTYIQ